MAEKYFLNNDWKFTKDFEDFSNTETVCIPHTVSVTPFNCFDESVYCMVSGYRKVINVPKEFKDKCVTLVFEGVAHDAVVYVDGEERIRHRSGYTAFEVDLSKDVKEKDSIEITVKVDSRETLNQPPFGYVIDYMTYGGIYREVYLKVSNVINIKDIFMHATFSKNDAILSSDLWIVNPTDKPVVVKQTVNGITSVNEFSKRDSGENLSVSFSQNVGEVKRWTVSDPALYSVVTAVYDKDGNLLDEREDTFGFRTSEFRENGYYINGKKLKLRGLNRHQSYPYVGYAMPKSMQAMDADILKNELKVNAVRTSHYPQSQDFINRCDEIGLLVFMEIPGWQHIGDNEWKRIAVNNVREMITQYRNHPSIILWGVRINESEDDDEFYEITNEEAHKFDPTRQTGGVRASKKSHLFEDVYTYNDFVHDGTNKGCEPKKKITPDAKKPYLISEYNGHMFPTKAYDCEAHRCEHALRHATVMDYVAKRKDIAGAFGWCMFDYNTHRDFGSGDRICYHGVMDMFRNEKLAASVYACQRTPRDASEVVLSVSSSMDIGDQPGCNRGSIWIFSNADSVKMYKNNRLLKEYFPTHSKFENLKYGPILVDDFVGRMIEEDEDYSQEAAITIKRIMNATALYGLTKLPIRIWLLAAKAILIHHVSMDEAVRLYNKYVGDWGGAATVYRFDAIKGGEVVKSLVKSPAERVLLKATADHTELHVGSTYDVSLIRIKATDQNGNVLTYNNEPVSLSTSGPISIIGPKIISLKGGMFGTFIKTEKTEEDFASAGLTLCMEGTEAVSIDFTIVKDDVLSL